MVPTQRLQLETIIVIIMQYRYRFDTTSLRETLEFYKL